MRHRRGETLADAQRLRTTILRRLIDAPRQPGSATGRDINTIAVDVASVLDDVPEIDPHRKLDAAIRRYIGVSLRHFALYFDRATYRVDNAGKFEEQAVV